MRPTLARSHSCLLLSALVLALAGACERAPAPIPSEPTPTPQPVTPAPEPVPPAPVVTEPAPGQLPEPAPSLLKEIAGVHYLEVVTGGAEADATLPMIVALHGNGAYPRLMKYAMLDDEGTSSRPAAPFDTPARFIFPRGSEAIEPPGHARWFSVTANEAMTDPAQLAELSTQIQTQSQLVADAITALSEARPTRGKPIVVGHSQGGILAFGLAVLRPEVFSAVYPLAGWLPRPLWPTQPATGAAAALPIVTMHGTADTLVSYAETNDGVTHLEQLGWTVTMVPYPGVKHVLSPMLAELRVDLLERVDDSD